MRHTCPECGCIFGASLRSVNDHRRFFKVIERAYANWPHGHPFQPSNAEHLRAYLLVQIDYIHAVTYDLAGADAVARRRIAREIVTEAIRVSRYAELRVDGTSITIITPKSINFESCTQKVFNPIREAVETEIETALGASIGELLGARIA